MVLNYYSIYIMTYIQKTVNKYETPIHSYLTNIHQPYVFIDKNSTHYCDIVTMGSVIFYGFNNHNCLPFILIHIFLIAFIKIMYFRKRYFCVIIHETSHT